MPFTLNMMTLDEQLAPIQPTGKHQPTVDVILSDEESGWVNQPFKGNHTLHDYDVTQSRIALSELVKEKAALEKKIPELQADFAKPVKEGGARLLTKNQLKDAYAALTLCHIQMTPAAETLRKHVALQETAIEHLTALRFITNEYKKTKDRNWLEKAVHFNYEKTKVCPMMFTDDQSAW